MQALFLPFLKRVFLAAGFLSLTTEPLEASTVTLAPRTEPLLTQGSVLVDFLSKLFLGEKWDIAVGKDCPERLLGVARLFFPQTDPPQDPFTMAWPMIDALDEGEQAHFQHKDLRDRTYCYQYYKLLLSEIRAETVNSGVSIIFFSRTFSCLQACLTGVLMSSMFLKRTWVSSP